MQQPSEQSPLTTDLERELDQLLQGETWQQHDRIARTLAKEPHLRITLIALKSGAQLDKHAADGPVTIQALRGRVRLSVQDKPIELARGGLLVLEQGVAHAVEALEESALLVTVGRPR
jgi:quercetin dioxygenase-like cupin family protein